MSNIQLNNIPAPTFAFVLNTISENNLFDHSNQIDIQDLYVDLNLAIGVNSDVFTFSEMWNADESKPTNESLEQKFAVAEDTLNILYALGCAYLMVTHYNHSNKLAYEGNTVRLLGDCKKLAYESLKQALIGIDEESYTRIGSLLEVNRLIYKMVSDLTDSLSVKIFTDIGGDHSKAVLILDMANHILKWCLDLDDGFALSCVTYLD